MPNPNNPAEHECQRCHDTGEIPGSYRLCPCTGVTEVLEQTTTAIFTRAGLTAEEQRVAAVHIVGELGARAPFIAFAEAAGAAVASVKAERADAS